MLPQTQLKLRSTKTKVAAILLLALGTATLHAQENPCASPQMPVAASRGTAYVYITWPATGSEATTGYEWQLTQAGQTVQQGTTAATGVLVQGLNQGTTYLTSVRALCGEGNYSEWVSLNAETLANNTPGTGQIGTGTGWALSLYGPILYTGSTIRNGSAADMLFTQEELATAGIPNGANITGVAFNKLGNASSEGSAPVEIIFYAANSVNTAPLNIQTTLADIQASHTEVLNKPDYELPATVGWIDFNFGTPFTYTGGGLEIATKMYHEPTNANGNTTHFTSFVPWEYTAGYSDYMMGTWVLPTVDMNVPETVIMNHNNGAGQFKERPNIKISYSYTAQLESVVVATAANALPEIIANNGTLQLNATVHPAAFGQMVIWEITEGNEFATVDQEGLVTALGNGSVTIKATSAEDDAFFGEITIAISNQLSCEEEHPGSTEPITRVQFADIDNASSADGGAEVPFTENFTTVTAQLTAGESYILTVKGNTAGEFLNHVTAYADWNQDNVFTEEETYQVGTLENSTGTDDTEAALSITVPETAADGNTVLRIVKLKDESIVPCNFALYGQTEYYGLTVVHAAAIDHVNKTMVTVYPNPVKDVLNITTTLPVSTVGIYNNLGQLVLSTTAPAIDMATLSSGMYIVKVQLHNGVQSVYKIIKG